VFVDVLEDADATDTEKVRAVKAMLGIEQKEAALEIEERQRDHARELPRPESREDAIASLLDSLSDPIVLGRFLERLGTAKAP
jgi:hypothetical protein